MEAVRYRFFTPTHTIFGEGCAREAGQKAKGLGASRVLLVTDQGVTRAGLAATIQAYLEAAGIKVGIYSDVVENPTAQNVREGRDILKEQGIQALVALGGGSPMDAAKAMSALSAHEGDIVEYELGLRAFERAGPPVIAIPTTAGTGAEVTMGAVISDPGSHRKIDVVSAFMAPSIALVDPELTLSLPPAITAATGMDALTHAVEGYTATMASPITDALHLQAIRLLADSLLCAYREGTDLRARRNVMLASMIAGIGFPNSGLGAVHGLALPLGGRFNIPHGVANAIMLPYVMRFNQEVSDARLCQVAEALGTPEHSAAAAIDCVFRLRSSMNLPSLASFAVEARHLDDLARDALGRNTNCATNPREVSEEDARDIYRMALAGA